MYLWPHPDDADLLSQSYQTLAWSLIPSATCHYSCGFSLFSVPCIPCSEHRSLSLQSCILPQLHWCLPVIHLTFLLISFALLCAHSSSYCLSFMVSDHDDFLASFWLSRSCTHLPKSQSWLNPALPTSHLQL